MNEDLIIGIFFGFSAATLIYLIIEASRGEEKQAKEIPAKDDIQKNNYEYATRKRCWNCRDTGWYLDVEFERKCQSCNYWKKKSLEWD